MVSILVPVYNSSRYLRDCVASLTGQTYTDLQIVLINDGSTDDSWDIMQELAKQDHRLEVYSQPNCGVAATRNRLLEKARGEFVLFVDSDDWIERDTVEILMQEQQYGCDMVVCNSPLDRLWNQEKAVFEFLRHIELRGMLWNKLMAKVLFDERRFDEYISYGEDALMVWELLQQVHEVRLLKKDLYHYSDNEDSLSRQRLNEKKFSAYYTWKKICDDTDSLWPQYKDIARARFTCEMTQILYFAVLYRYPYDEKIKLIQNVVRQYGFLIKKTGISTPLMSVLSYFFSRHYLLSCFFSPILRLIRKYKYGISTCPSL